ncbi:MAG: 30S ribosomal protein S8e [Nitrososphaerales archaeon]|nr:30S ribosomal protein S8e [Nitrososphaerales archaeon]
MPYENILKRKPSGGRRKPHAGVRKYQRDGYTIETLLGAEERVKKRVRGGGVKIALKMGEYANVLDPVSKKVTKVKILRVLSNPANFDFERKGVITKGAILDTELGRAKVTSRPSQHGVINAILIK